MSASTTVHFVRHGEVDNAQRIYYGRLPGFHLSSEGRQQAKIAAKALQKYKITAIYSSPLERARETAEIIEEQAGLTSQVSELLTEVYSSFDGQPIRVLVERNWDGYTGSPQPFEQPSDVLHRAISFTRKVRKEYPGEHIVAVTHGDVIAFMVLWAKQLPVEPQEKRALYQSFLTYASISSFIYETSLETEIPRFEYSQS